MIEYVATPAGTEHFELAEGPVWDAARSRLLWVDILRGLVVEGTLLESTLSGAGAGVDVVRRHQFDEMVTAVVPAEDGRLLVAAQERLVVIGVDGDCAIGPRIFTAGESRRTNDGAVDPAGRFLIGTLALGGQTNEESLYRVERDGSLLTLDDDLGLSNGLAWSPDGRTLYSVDTLERRIWRRSYPKSGAPGERELYLLIEDGYPDGMCMDTDGYLWIAMWGAGEVRRYAPDGSVAAVVRTTAPHTSSVAFVGPDLDRLLITTARQNLTPEQLVDYPDSGLLFLADVDATGVPATAWSGNFGR